MRQGLVEWALVTAFLALAAAGAAHLFGDEIRGAFGVHRPSPPRVEPAPAAPAPRAP
jgi:hypothetical protein